MNYRNVPCNECRELRRKCTIDPGSSSCVRCTRLNKLCVLDSKQEMHNAEIKKWTDQVENLEETIAQLQLEMDRMRNCTVNNNNNKPSTALTRKNDKNYNTSSQELLDALTKNFAFRWKVEIKNGTFRIETGIRNIHDLLQCQFDSMGYLSPISNLSSSDDEPDTYRGNSDALIQFGQHVPKGGDLMPFTIKMLALCAKKDHAVPKTFSLPRQLLLNSRLVIDDLIQIYFACHNDYSPFLHEKMFMYKYHGLKDPLSDPLTLSICSHVCSTPCDHLQYNAQDRRNMGDYFYFKARSIILGQFDEPDKRLENVICVNVLLMYMNLTMNFRDCRKLVMMAYQICLDLRDEYPLSISGDFLNSIEDEHVSELIFGSDEYMSRLDHVLYSRNVAAILFGQRSMGFIADRAIDDNSYFYFPKWLYMHDESDLTKHFVNTQNYALNIFNDPFIENVMRQVLNIHLGKKCTLTFESIVRLDDVFDEWFKSLPFQFCITKNFRDEVKCKKAIDQCSDCTLLLTFTTVQLFMIGIYSTLLQPIALGKNIDLLLTVVQKSSLDHTLTGSRLLSYMVLRILEIEKGSRCHFTLAASECLFYVIDILLILSLSKNKFIATESKGALRDCMEELDKVDFFKDHRVPVSTSPVHLGLVNLDDPDSYHIDYYNMYPYPWVAMIYDASRFVTYST